MVVMMEAWDGGGWQQAVGSGGWWWLRGRDMWHGFCQHFLIWQKMHLDSRWTLENHLDSGGVHLEYVGPYAPTNDACIQMTTTPHPWPICTHKWYMPVLYPPQDNPYGIHGMGDGLLVGSSLNILFSMALISLRISLLIGRYFIEYFILHGACFIKYFIAHW